MTAYAGIGSRKTPPDILDLMMKIAKWMSWAGYSLRTGGAEGADLAFERGAMALNGSAVAPTFIYLPWPGYNSIQRRGFHHSQVMDAPSPAAFREAARHHPVWKDLSDGAKCLHARNCHIVLGETLDRPVQRIICWTPNGKETGGTAQAMRIARKKHISIHNLHNPQTMKYYQRMLRT